MRTPTVTRRRPTPTPDRTGQDREGLALLLGAVGLCAVIGVAAGWTLLFGPPTVPWPAIAVLAVLAIAACAGVVATVRARGHRPVSTPPISTPPGVGYPSSHDDPSEWS
jgi:hypothetical protein